MLREHWFQLSSWTPEDWRLGFGVFLGTGQPLGVATLRARDFRVNREATTWSWLGLAHQRQGYGTEARTALLTLAFDYLDATDATTEVFQDHHKSQGVSRKLGYVPDGITNTAEHKRARRDVTREGSHSCSVASRDDPEVDGHRPGHAVPMHTAVVLETSY